MIEFLKNYGWIFILIIVLPFLLWIKEDNLTLIDCYSMVFKHTFDILLIFFATFIHRERWQLYEDAAERDREREKAEKERLKKRKEKEQAEADNKTNTHQTDDDKSSQPD